ncbi:MAG: T9SS type A sorting domain-containing protein [Algibacter sp.]
MRAIKITLVLLSLITTAYGQNSLTINDLEAGPGDDANIIIRLDNTENVAGLQFKIKIPSNITVREKESQFIDRASDHVIYPRVLGNGEYLFLCFSGTNSSFSGQSGDLIEIPIEIPLSYISGETYELVFTEVIVSSSEGTDIGSNHINGELEIIEGKTPDLTVESITIAQDDILPNGPCSISWNIRNIGLSEAIGGWREQISLVSQVNGRKYIIGNTSYDNSLLDGASVARTTEVIVPSIIGFDGDVKIEVAIITNSELRESASAKTNNTMLSSDIENLLKRLIFTVDKNEIIENSKDSLRLNAARSGETDVDEVFTISSDVDNVFDLPNTIQINKDESSNFIFIKPTDNITFEGNRSVALKVNGDSYSEENIDVSLIDDENIILTLEYPDNYNSSIESTIEFTLKANFSVNEDRIINLSTERSDRLQLPSEVTIVSGSQEVIFEGTILDTQEIEKSEVTNIFAKAEAYTTAVKAIHLDAINIPNFSLSIAPNQVSEGDGFKATYATLSRSNQLDKKATLLISANEVDKVIIPSEIFFDEGETEKTFNISTVDNDIVDGDKAITINVKIEFEGCACTDNSDPNTTISQDITILDNDGLALELKTSPSTIKAGANGNKLVISRNTDNPAILQNAVTVNLSSDSPEIIDLPTVAIIPANENEVEITFNTIVDPNQSEDKNVRIQAVATNHSSGFAWLLISNQNKADVLISEIATNTTAEAGSKLTIRSNINNQGNADFPSKSKIDYYFTKTTDIGNSTPIVSSIMNKAIAQDEIYEYEEDIQLPNTVGGYFLTALINADYAISELDYENNQQQIQIEILPSYTIDVSINKTSYTTNEIIEVTGIAKTASDNPVPDADIALNIANNDFERNYTIKTDANGAFLFEYIPLENETGSYTLTAAFPGEDISPQQSFELLGFEILSKPQYIKWETVVGETLDKEFILKNKTNTKLTGVKIQVPVNNEFVINQTPVDIEPGTTVNFPYEIVPIKASTELKYSEYDMTIVSNEGAEYGEIVYYYCKNQEASLIANPISINTTMVKGQTRLYEFIIKNVGAIDAEDVELLLPELDWLSLSTPKIIEKVKPNEEVKIGIELEPTDKEQVNVPITGNFVLKQKAGVSLSIPFRIETVSESTGKLIVEATDEYTYNTASGPKLKNAKVVVKHPYTGAIVAEGFTNESGVFEVPDIIEGWYEINISAEKHNPYQNNILVDPGKETKLTAFLPYQAVTYSWDVQETEVIDEYEISLTTDFETNVPKPVVVMEIDNPDLDLNPGESRMTYVSVTNHGLITAEKVSFSFGEIDGYSIKPLVTTFDVLNAKSSIIVPVLVKNEDDSGKSSKLAGKSGKTTNTSSGTCTVPVTFRATYPCDGEKEMFSFTAYKKVKCASPTGGGFGGGGNGGGGLGGSGGGGFSGGGGSGPSGIGESGDPVVQTPDSQSSNPIPLPDFCDPCLKALTSSLLNCIAAAAQAVPNPYFKAYGVGVGRLACGFDFITSVSATDALVKTPIGCKWAPAGCFIARDGVVSECFESDNGIDDGTIAKVLNNKTDFNTNVSIFDLIFEDLAKIAEAEVAHENWLEEYFKNPDLETNIDYLLPFLSISAGVLDAQRKFTSVEIEALKNEMLNTTITEVYIDSFVTRWNMTVEAWKSNIFSPNSQYPNIVDKVKLDEYKTIKISLEPYAFQRGFVSPEDMYISDITALNAFIEEKTQNTSSICATVSIEFPQQLTMTRQAFEGALKINNSSNKAITEIDLDLVVTDENGENKTHLFQINKDEFLDGIGTVNPDSDGQGIALFIPTKEAAPEVPTSYGFGGILSYFDPEVGETVNITLNPVTLEVNPSPDLELHYFMQRDILGDDSLTDDIVEPSIPAELALMIKNDGFGLARNVNVESMQPRIIENEKGLLIDFNMIGSSFNNEPTQLGLLNVDFGDIEGKQTAIGQWFFTSSLIGHFVSYDVQVNHKSNFGNDNLSLIKGAYIHEFVKSVTSYGNPNDDDIADFLVNDKADVYDTPDAIYLSDGTSEDVSKAERVEIIEEVTPESLTAKVRINPITTGWNYGNILDPAGKLYNLTKVIRDSDNFEIPLGNFWQTQVTLKDGLNPKYESKLHVLDKVSGIETYTLYFNPIDGDIPKVDSFVDAPEQYTTASVDFITVQFNKEIDFNTFTNTNIELIHQGVLLPSDDIMIGKINDTTFSINIQSLTNLSGFYELTVQALGIKDLVGNEGKDGKKINWVQLNNELGITQFESDQLKKNPINSITVIFNKPIRSEEFTTNKITINDAPVNGLSIQEIDNSTYTISGINTLNENDDDYIIAIDVTQIKAVDGVSGLTVQTFEWMVDSNLPKVNNIETISQGTNNRQIITALEVELNRVIVSNLESSAFTFTKNGEEVSIPIIIQKIDDLHYSILGLESYTSINGTYTVIIDQSGFRDENDNLGEGVAETSWTVNIDVLTAISNLRLTPDRGVSASDNITSGSDVQLVYQTLLDDVTVEVYEVLESGDVLIDKQFRTTKAEYSIPLENQFGTKTYKVIAYDDYGNNSNAETLSGYIDFTDIVVEIKPINQVSNDCTDFDFIEVDFSEEITDNSFSNDAITLKSKGVVIPKNDITVRKESDRKYIVENIQNPNNGSIIMEVDKTKISKKISGLNGFSIKSLDIGSPNNYPVTITGEEEPEIGVAYEYSVDDDMNKYDWIIINGEILSSESNKVTVKWNKSDSQSLILRYQTPLNCTLTETVEVIVNEGALSIDGQIDIEKNFISPVPNNGQFTIHTNVILNDCTLSIFDVTGKLIHEEKRVNLSRKVKDIDVSLNSGTYFLILQNNEERLHFKFLVK